MVVIVMMMGTIVANSNQTATGRSVVIVVVDGQINDKQAADHI